MLKNLSLNVKEMEKYIVDTYEDRICELVGIHYIFRFPNGYGASVVKIFGSQGYELDLWELAVILFEEETDILKSTEYIIVYPQNIVERGMVKGNLTEKDVYNNLKIIKEL